MTAPDIDLAEANLVALFSESILYGIFLATFGECLRAIIWRGGSFQAREGVRRAFLVVTCAMCIIATLDIVLSLVDKLDAFIHYKGPGGAHHEFAHISSWINIVRLSIFAMQMLIGDGILIYRTYIVYGHNSAVVFPLLLLWLGVAVTAFAIPVVASSFKNDVATITANRLNSWTNAAGPIEVALNLLGTSLIAYRIWFIARQTPAISGSALSSPSPLDYALRIIVESGTIYTSSMAILLGTSIAKSNAESIVQNSLVPTIGICFNLIIVRVNWHNHAPPDPLLDAERPPRRILGIPVRLAKGRTPASGKTASSAPIKVAVSQRVEYDGGSSLGTANSGNSATRDMWAAA